MIDRSLNYDRSHANVFPTRGGEYFLVKKRAAATVDLIISRSAKRLGMNR
jgi:hypothetical protein